MFVTNKDDKSVSEEADEIYGSRVVQIAKARKREILYKMVLLLTFWHISGAYGFYLMFTAAKLATIIFAYSCIIIGDLGVTAGAHRLWTHRAYKAKLPLEIILMVFHTIAYQFSAIEWIKIHRLHHKYTDTDADPHNASRGLFYSHMGWLMVPRHPEVRKHAKHIDMSDVLSNPVLLFQRKYLYPLVLIFSVIIPVFVPMYFWDESLNVAWHINIHRYILSLHCAWTVNSLAHAWGYKPYDSTLLSTENHFVSLLTIGEGYHNYHHVFPWDYRASELRFSNASLTTPFINFFAWIGWAYDLKTVPADIVRARAERTGDGSM